MPFTRLAQALGLPLAEVKKVLSLADRGGSPCGRVQEALEEKLAEVDRRLSELRRFRRDLANLVQRAKTDYANRPGARVCAIVENAEPTRSVASGLLALRVGGTGRRRAAPVESLPRSRRCSGSPIHSRDICGLPYTVRFTILHVPKRMRMP